MGQISDFLDDDDKRREAASAGTLQAVTPQPATPPAAPPARAAQPESEISRFLADAPPPDRGLKGWAQDIGATAVKGLIGAAEAGMGLTDLATGGLSGRAAEGLGLRFKDWREKANDWHSEATKEAQRQYQQAEGVTGKVAAALQNPSVIASAVGEALPQMFAGGLIGRGLMLAGRAVPALAGRIGPALAGALGEGIVGAGSAAEQIRQESPDGLLTGRQAGLAGLSGVADAGFGLLGGKMAQRLGIGDVETMLAGAGRAAAKPAAQPVAKGLPRQMAQGALSEGVLEELPQSVSEQALQNIALDRPWQEDVDSAAVLGTLTGGVMGAGASGLHGLRSRPAGAEPLKPSQRMGLDANAGQLSAAAVVAVDSGASPAALAVAAQQGALQESAEARQAALAAGQAQGPREAAALERVAALDEQLAAARQSLAALDAQAAAPDGAQDEPQQAARAQLAQQVQQLQAERESLTQGWPRMQAGKALSFGTESGAQLAGHWALAEADQLVTSHDEGLRQNPAYPQQLQPRERSRAASEAQIARMAQRLQPERLAHSADAATGAPIVGADGLVESGNARSIAIKRVYAGQGPQAAAYKDFLQAHAAEFGLTPEQVAGMQKPVLVRVRDTPVNRAEFARQANAPTVAMMSPAEQARADAARMDSMDGLEPDESGDFSGAASRGFVRRFMARLPVSEQAAMVDADGRLSSAGYARVRNAVLAKAWGTGEQGGDALARMTESLDDNTRSISRALMMAAPETARMREAIAAGARHDADIAGDVAAAAQEISRLREAGQSVQQALAQTDAFGDKHTPEARALMQFMAGNARRPRRIAQLIQAYWQALDAAGDPHQQGMFGGQAAPTKQALLQAAMRQVQDAPAQGAAPESAPQEREAQDRAQAAWNALPPEGRHQLALAAGVQGVVARNAARHADWIGLPAAMQQRLAQAVQAAPEAAQAALSSRRAKALTDDERAAVLQGPPVASLTGDEAPKGYPLLRAWAIRLFKAQGGYAQNPELGRVTLDERSVRDSMAHRMNPFKAAAFAAVKDVIERGVVVASAEHDGLQSFYVSAPVQIAGKDDIVTALVRRGLKDQRMYLHSVATKESLLKLINSEAASAGLALRDHGLSRSGGVSSVAPAGAPGKLPGHHVAQRLHELLTRRVGAASAAPGRDNAGHETAHKSVHESGVPRGLAASETADSRQIEGIINRNLERSGQEAAFKALAVGTDQLPDALRGALAAFERATGARAVVFRNLTPHVADFNGVTVRDGTLFINETSQSPVTGVAAHEWLHNLRRTHPALYHELAAEVARQGDAQGFARQWGYAPGEAQEELTAAAVGDAMTDPQFLARLAEQDGSLFARVAKSFLAFLDTLTARWRSQGSNAYLRDVQAFRDKLAAVLQAYEQQAGQAGGVGQAGLPQAMFQRVWHGTPHKGIEKTGFRLDKIGTGEGLQVYGHGIYFASRREVAEFYRGMRQGQVRLDGRLMTDGHHRGAASTGDAEVDALLLDAQGDVDQAIAWARDFGQNAQAAKLERLRGRVQRGEPGQLYAAEIPEDDDLLDWDKPLDEQPAKVRRALLELAGGLPADGRAAFRQAMARRATGQDVYAFLARRAAGADASAEGVQKGQRAASELLLAHGIPGLRYLDGDSRNAGEGSHNYVIWDEGLLTPEAAQIAPQYSRKQATKAAYERRIDELFAGGHASRQGAVLLDGSDVMGLLGHEHVPLVLNERHLLDGRSSHPEMTAAAWKRVPEWLENPAAVYDDPRHPGRLTVIAPETLAGYPVVMAVELEPDNPHDPRAHQLLVTAFAKTTGDLPALGFLAASGRLQYVDTKTAPVAWPDTGDVPRTAGRAHGARRILTEKSLAAWRKAQAAKAGDAPAFSLPESRASRQVKREASALKVQQAQRLVKALSRGWANAPEVVIASSVRDEALPETARRAIAQQESRSAGGRVEGFYWQGKVYLVAGNLPSMHDVARVYMHETLGHYGLRGVYGEKLNSILNRTGMAMRGEVIERARQYGFHGLGATAKTASDAQVWDSMTDKQKLDSAEEALAYLAQTGGKVGDEKSLGLLRELVAAIRSWLRAHVPVFANLRYSDDEIMREFILPARRWVKNGSGQADDASDVMFQLAWHGTPYRGIEKTGFKLNKIGTGEGAQAYGWGIYFASQRHVAEEYRRNLTRDTPQARYEMLGKHKDMLDRQIRQGGSYLRYDEQGRVIAQGLALKDGADMKGVVIQPYSKWKLAKLKKQASELEAQMNELRPLLGPGGSIVGGQLYQTEVPEDKDLLIWDSPWNKQPLKVRRSVVNFLRQVSNGPVHPTQSDVSRIHAADALKHRIQNRKRSDALTGKDLYTAFRGIFGGPKAASEALHAAGVPGLRYLDGMSRAGGEGTYNYVIWDEALLTPEAAQIAPQYSRKRTDADWQRAEAAAAAAAQEADGVLMQSARDELQQRFWDEVQEYGTVDEQPVSTQGLQTVDEDGDPDDDYQNTAEWQRRVYEAVDAAVQRHLPAPFASFEDVDAHGTASQAFAAARAALDALGVPYDERGSGAGGYTGYIFVHRGGFDAGGGRAEDVSLKLRFADHGNQSARHSEADYNWFGQRGVDRMSEPLRNMVEDAVAFHDGDKRITGSVHFSRKQATQAAYDKRIDALFAGARPALQGVRVLDRSDVLGLLGMSDGPVHLVESKVEQGRFHHGLTASDWKKVPEWLDRPAAVFDSETTPGRLVFIAPERVRGAPVRMVIDPREQDKGVNLLINAYDAERNPFARWEREGLLRYFDRQQAQKAAPATGSFQPRLTGLPGERGRGKILTEKHLAGWRKLHAGQAQPGDEAASFSRRAPEPLEPRPDEAARLKESALEQLDRVFSHPGTVSWWHKTVGTMRNLAERQPLFKPVYEAAQQFIDDVSHFANDAADFAPRLLPRLESWRDLGKRAVSAADSQAVAAPLFEGTLSYTRGKDGSLVKTDNVDAAGVVFTDAELKGRFGLTPAQIELYRQARAAIDRSIDTTARADILRLAGSDFAHLRQAVMDAPDLRAAAVQVVEAMQEAMQSDAKRRDALREAIAAAQERVQTAQALMQRGYAPLTRFGRYTLDVVDAQGQRQYFGLYESRREANVAAIHLRSQYPGAQVTQGTLSDDAYKLFAGITPESLELFGDLLAAPGQGKDKGQDKAFQAWLQLARNNRSAIKRLIHRKGVAGYSQDAGRVLASFIYANARQTAGALNAGRMDRAIAAIPKEQGQLRDVAMALRDYTQNPREEGQAIRGMLFAQYLGGSLASAAVNMTQPFAVTLPWLSQFGGMRQAAAQMTRALADMARPGHRYEADLARDMKKAEEDGVVSPQEIHQLMAQARGAGALRSGDGTRRGDALAAAANAWERLKVAWGQPFALAEQFNRRSTYIAAWRLARQQGMADADAFARRAVLETQFVYCVDEQTECLTAAGWKRRAELSPGEVVFGVDETGAAVETPLLAVHVFPGRHTVTEFSNSSRFSMRVTSGHRHVVQNYNSRDKKWQKPSIRTTAELRDGHHLMRVPAAEIARDTGDANFAALIGWIAAEGHYAKFRNCKSKRNVRLFQSASRNPEYVAEIERLLVALGGHYRRFDHLKNHGMVTFTLKKPLSTRVLEAMPQKLLTWEMVRQMSAPEMRALLDAFAKGDGSKLRQGGWSIGQKQEQNLHVLQAMSVLCGQNATLSPAVSRETGKVAHLYLHAQGKRTFVKQLRQAQLQVHDGVWCPETGTGTWIARRNGAVFVTGNSKANKPRWGRGAVGGALFTFKTYSVSYLELMHRMWTQGGTPGKQGVAWMLAMLLLMGGAGGLPFMEDAEDLIDGLAQLAGYNTSVKQWRRQALQDIVGNGLAEFIESGVSGLPGAPIDISGRLGMGNLLPGTGLLLTKQNRERDLLDVAGPAGDLLARGFTAGRKLLTGDAGGAAMELAPTAARNLAKGADMLATGSYRDAKGYKVLDTTALEALAKAAGFQPRSVAQVQEGNSFLMRSKSFYQHTSAEIKAQWARALFEKDEAALQRVRQRVADWNRHNPEQPITVRMPDIWRRVREMGKERSQRIADSAPRALRQQMRQALAQEG